ncbi:LamG-like jellyroll fold domain-containing protein [Kitasatospora sp. NPDC047058]|uniref:LamG-like jellyroll fold domain-containing protein n=1 Tax=Kitasatospora sp. NPDC047058 TaxID=3155620 RepID=UPI0033C549B0
MSAAPPGARPAARLGPPHPSRRTAVAAAVPLVLALSSIAPAAFADTAPTAPPLPPVLAATMAKADAARAGDKPPATAVDKAIAQAKSTGRPVPVPELTDEFSETAATPQGHLAHSQHPEQQRVKQNGTWSALDATLVADPAGGYRPKASAAGVHLSAGGPGPLATLTSEDGKALTVDSPFPLTTAITGPGGNSLLYPEVAPGIDLKVTATKYGGLSTVLVVKTAEAAGNPKLKSVHFGTTTRGVTLRTDAEHNLAATAEDGTLRWHAPAPRMWDSSKDTPAAAESTAAAGKSAPVEAPRDSPAQQTGTPAPQKSGDNPDSTVDGPGKGAKVAVMPTKATADGIDLTTDQNILGKGQGPWFIDPGWIYDTRSGNTWTWTQSAYPGKANIGLTVDNGGGKYARPGVGYQGYLPTKGVERSYFQLDTRGFAGTIVHKATLSLWEYESSDWSCTTKYWLDAYLTSPIDNRTTWSNPPGVVGGRLGEAQVAGSGQDGCHDNVQFDYDVTSAYQTYSGDHDTLTFGVFARDESSSSLGFKRLTYNPVVVVEYDRPPTPPTDPYVSPSPGTTFPWADNQGCDGSSIGWLSAGSNFNGAVTLNATVHSPVQNDLYMWTHIWDYSLPDWPVVDEGYSAAVPNGKVASFNVRSDVIKDGHVYGWGAHAADKLIGMSDAAPNCRFGVDLTPPSLTVPDVSRVFSDAELSEQYPPSGNGQITKKRTGEWGIVPFSAVDTPADNGTASGIACARWSWDPNFADAQGQDWICGGRLPVNGVAVLPNRWGTNIVYLQVMDQARNFSPKAQYAFYVPWNSDGPPPVFGDMTGDSAPDILTADQAGNLRTYTVPGNPLAKSPPITLAAGAKDAPDGVSWANAQITHRGTLTGGNHIDDVIAHAPGGPKLYVYGNPGNDGFYGHVGRGVEIEKPGCTARAADPVTGIPAEDCAWFHAPGYNAADWSNALRIAAIGDPVNTNLNTALKFKNKTGLLTVESTNNGTDAALWYYPATAGNILGKPVQLAASGWKDKELLSPGDWAKQGHPGLWARNLLAGPDGAQGDLRAYTFATGTVVSTTHEGLPEKDASNKPLYVPTLTKMSSGVKVGQVSVDGWPVLGSDGDLTGNGSATLWGKRANGQIDIWWGQTTDPGTANPGFAWQVGPERVADTAVNPLWWSLDGKPTKDGRPIDSTVVDPLYPTAFTRTTDHNGEADRATAFSGSTVYRSSNRAPVDTTKSYSVAAWVKIDNTDAYQTAVSLAGTERSPFYLQFSKAFGSTGRWSFTMAATDQYNTGAYYAAVDDNEPQVGGWTHLVGTYNAETRTATLYVNGRAAGTTIVPQVWNTNGSVVIGGESTTNHPGPDSRLTGAIGDVRIYPYVFTDQQANTMATSNSRVQIRSTQNTGKCVDDWGGAVGAMVAVHDCWNGDSQHLTLTSDNRIKVRGSADRCLGLSDKPGKPGSRIQIQTCGSDLGQVWERRSDGTLYNPESAGCLEIPAWNTANGSSLGIWNCNGTDNANQRWFFRAQTTS